MITAYNPDRNHQITRNALHFKKIPETVLPSQINIEDEDEEENHGVNQSVPCINNPLNIETNATGFNKQPPEVKHQQTERKTYPRRNRRQPERFYDISNKR